MRKLFLALTWALLLCCATALAATSTTDYTLETLNATVSLADSYIVLREENLDAHPEIDRTAVEILNPEEFVN